MKQFIHFSIKIIFKIIGYYNIIYDILSHNIYRLINTYNSSYINNIKIINTTTNSVTIHGNNLQSIKINKNDADVYYVINIWNKESYKNMYFILNSEIFYKLAYCNNKPNEKLLIKNLIHSKYINNNIYAIIISNKDVTHIFEKYFESISIHQNVTAHVLYLYYCYKYHVQPSIQNSYVTIVNYDLDEIVYHYNDIINV